MTSAEPRRRRDLKSQDREKSLSPLDKDHLKQRCLERVRSERSRLLARMRGRRGLEEGQRLSGTGAGAGADSPFALATVQGENSLSAREILRQGLSDLSGANGATSRRFLEQQTQQEQQAVPPRPPIHQSTHSSPGRLDSNGDSARDERHHIEPSSSVLSAIEEENASYLSACSGGRGRGSPQQLRPPASTSLREECQGFLGGASDDAVMVDDDRGGERELMLQQKQQQQQQRRRQPEIMEGDGLGWGDDGAEGYCDEEHMLSPDEYLEMMQYIEEACKEEDRRAEAEALEEYEMTKRLEEEEIEYAISSGLCGVDGDDQADAVLCPICKRDYLVQAGAPSSSIVCACGFRLDTAGDRLGLEHLRQQLAETYSHHSAGCSADPGFALEGASGLDVLWSSCETCGFARVVL